MFFGKKDKAKTTVNDIIWMSAAAKWKGILEKWKKNNHTVVVCWFPSTLREAEDFFTGKTDQPVQLLLTREIHTGMVTNNDILFAEHYPLSENEIVLYKKLGLKEVQVHAALDEPLFVRFGGEKITSMMKQMGMKEEQSVQHKLISAAIANAQHKIAKRLKSTPEMLANSPAEWLEKNYPA